MEQALAKAYGAGYIPKPIDGSFAIEYNEKGQTEKYVVSKSEILLDPLFWQCLGKAMGWGDLTVSRDDWTTQPKWLYEWKNLVEHLAKNKDTESFFNELLK